MIYSPVYSKDPELREEFLRLSAVLAALSEGLIQVAYVEPKRLKVGMVLICDGVYWNPLGDGLKRPIWYNGTAWEALSGGAESAPGGTIDAGNPASTFTDEPLIDLGRP